VAGQTRSKLLLRLLEAGANAFEQDQQARVEARRAAVLSTSGAYADAFPAAYLRELRADWPA